MLPGLSLAGCVEGGGRVGFDLRIDARGADLAAAVPRDRSDLSSDERPIVEELAADGRAVRYTPPRLDDGDLLSVDGDVYDLSVRPGETEALQLPVLVAERVDPATVEDAPRVYDAYDGAAIRAVEHAVAHAGRDEPYAFYPERERPASLDPAPDVEVVRWDDEHYRLRVEERTVRAERVEYEWTRLPEDAVEETVRERHEIVDVADADPSEAARSIMVQARDEPPYEAVQEYSEAEREVLKFFGSLPGPRPNEGWLHFEGEYCWGDLERWHSD